MRFKAGHTTHPRRNTDLIFMILESIEDVAPFYGVVVLSMDQLSIVDLRMKR